MKLGIMLPVYRAYSQGEFEKIDAILAAGFSTLWLREWPSGIGVPGQRDHGSGHDPLIHAVQLDTMPSVDTVGELLGIESGGLFGSQCSKVRNPCLLYFFSC